MAAAKSTDRGIRYSVTNPNGDVVTILAGNGASPPISNVTNQLPTTPTIGIQRGGGADIITLSQQNWNDLVAALASNFATNGVLA